MSREEEGERREEEGGRRDVYGCRQYNKKYSVRKEKPLFQVLVKVLQETSKIAQGIATALDYFPELEGKNIVLKTRYTLETGYGAMELELTWKRFRED